MRSYRCVCDGLGTNAATTEERCLLRKRLIKKSEGFVMVKMPVNTRGIRSEDKGTYQKTKRGMKLV